MKLYKIIRVNNKINQLKFTDGSYRGLKTQNKNRVWGFSATKANNGRIILS